MTTHHGIHTSVFTKIDDAGPHGQFILDSDLTSGTDYATSTIRITLDIFTDPATNATQLEQNLRTALLNVVKPVQS